MKRVGHQKSQNRKVWLSSLAKRVREEKLIQIELDQRKGGITPEQLHQEMQKRGLETTTLPNGKVVIARPQPV